MTEFLAILAVVYMCNATAETRVLSAEEAASCNDAYDVVKARFIEEPGPEPPGTVARHDQNVAAYLAFKQWEAENATLVTEMKRAVRSSMRETPAASVPPGQRGL